MNRNQLVGNTCNPLPRYYMSGRRTNKHKTVQKVKQEDDFSNKVISLKNIPHLVNALIDQGECSDLQRAKSTLQKIYDDCGKKGSVTMRS